MNDNHILLKVRHLRVSFKIAKDSLTEVLKGISFDIPESRTVALVGESGSGKSVTALAIMGLLSPDVAQISSTSSVVFEGQELLTMPMTDRRKLCGAAISMIFQDPMSSLNPVFTVGYQISEVLRLHRKMDKAQAKIQTIKLLAEVGIPDPESRINSYPHQLSGGQQQRVMIAMAIACEPKLLIADEPTTALDVTVQRQIMALLQTLQNRHKMSVLFITHDLQLVSEIADDVVVIRYGKVKEQAPVDQIFMHPSDPYTRALMLCRPPMNTRPIHLPVINDVISAGGKIPNAMGERVRGYRANDKIILEAKHLFKTFEVRRGFFQKKVFHAVKDVSFTLPYRKTLGIVGESGSGKTTLGLTVMRLHQANSGQVIFDGNDILAMTETEFLPFKRKIQVIFQNPYASLNPRFTIGQILMEPMLLHGIGDGLSDRRDLAYEWLKRVGLPSEAFKRYPHEFSGGQRQRIAIARCLTMQPEVILCDESVSALDVSVQAQILNLLQDLQDEFGLSYLFISHDLSVVKYMADQVMVMKGGEVVEMANSDEIYQNPSHPYTRELLAAIPKDKYSMRTF